MAKKINVRFSFRVYEGNKPYIGPGRVELLQHINRYGSIAKAAKAMSMSYRKAWQMVKDLNALSKNSMVTIRLGGKKGGGAEVTAAGLEVINKYFELKQKADAFFASTLNEIQF